MTEKAASQQIASLGNKDKSLDPLSRLPNELVDAIFSNAHSPGINQPLCGPPSKRLLSCFNRALYRHVEIWSWKALKQLCRTAESNPDLFEIIERLAINPTRGGGPTSQPMDPFSPLQDQVVSMFKRLVSLQHLVLGRSGDLACLAVVAKLVANFPFSSTLVSLDLSGQFLDTTYSTEPVLAASLSIYSKLSSFQYAVRPFDFPSTLDFKLLPLISLPALRRLELTGISLPMAQLGHLLASSPALTDLTLQGTNSASALFELLRKVPNPTLVRHLTLYVDIWRLDRATEVSAEDLATLGQFTALESIDLSLPFSPLLFETLSKLPLRQLVLQKEVDISAVQLGGFVSGPTKIDNLARIELNSFFSVKGHWVDDIEMDEDLSPEEVAEMDPDDFGWELPDWDRTPFKREELRQFLSVAESENVKVDGEAIDALVIHDEWDRLVAELMEKARARAGETGDDEDSD